MPVLVECSLASHIVQRVVRCEKKEIDKKEEEEDEEKRRKRRKEKKEEEEEEEDKVKDKYDVEYKDEEETNCLREMGGAASSFGLEPRSIREPGSLVHVWD